MLTGVDAVIFCPDCLHLGRRHPCPRCWERWRLKALRGLPSAIEPQLTKYPLPGSSLWSMTVHASEQQTAPWVQEAYGAFLES